ncbi:NERD domain-containing protein [Bacillus sp. FJAT-42376]|uniref:NERD domain-containing protein n=1 Tax=Bacillus sp. FJAT-42376 TaxID=2014076 RepID=UPI000F4FC42F|nr:NERD domain-containing protein [Bacillus sp. FJAT-42376]AZB43991.1 NERD domain-containing protein [Bacillus sp. FJAT-42376]
MGQLIKLKDYISRYETDPYHYTSQFIRLKKHQWDRLNKAWEERKFDPFIVRLPDQAEKETKVPFWGKWTLQKNKTEEDSPSYPDIEIAEDSPDLMFTHVPSSNDELKHEFLDKIYRFQLKWASSTIREQSDFDRRYFYDESLQFFLKRLPDHNMYMHDAVFELKNATVETGPVLITPTGIQCIAWIPGKKEDILTASHDRFWTIKRGRDSMKILNPLLALNRTSTIVNGILEKKEIDFPVTKNLIFQNGYIDFQNEPYNLGIIDKRGFSEWFTKMRNFSSPIKHDQLRSVKALLTHTHTRSRIRSGWEEDGGN